MKFICASNMMCKTVKFGYRGKFIRISKSLYSIIFALYFTRSIDSLF